jgi:hypothetical protein
MIDDDAGERKPAGDVRKVASDAVKLEDEAGERRGAKAGCCELLLLRP